MNNAHISSKRRASNNDIGPVLPSASDEASKASMPRAEYGGFFQVTRDTRNETLLRLAIMR